MTVRQFQIKDGNSSFPVVIDKQDDGSYVAIECKTRSEGGNRKIDWSCNIDSLIILINMEYEGCKITQIF